MSREELSGRFCSAILVLAFLHCVSDGALALDSLPGCAVQLYEPGADASGTYHVFLYFRSADIANSGVIMFVPRSRGVENVLLLYVEKSYLKLYQNSSGSGFSNPLGTQGVNIRQFLEFKSHILLLTYSRNASQGRQWLHVNQIAIDFIPIVGNSGVSDLAVMKFLNSDFVQGWTPPFVYSRWSACIQSWQYTNGPVVPINSTDIELDGDGGWCCNGFDVPSPPTQPAVTSANPDNRPQSRSCACGARHVPCSKDQLVATFPGDAPLTVSSVAMQRLCDTPEHYVSVIQLEILPHTATTQLIALSSHEGTEIAAFLADGVMTITLKVQNQTGQVSLDEKISLQKWTNITIYIKDNTIQLQVNGGIASYTSPIKINQETWRQALWSVVLGQSSQGRSDQSFPPYKGCMRRVLVNGYDILKESNRTTNHGERIRSGHVFFSSQCTTRLLKCSQQDLLLLRTPTSHLLISDGRLRRLKDVKFTFKTDQERGQMLLFQSTSGVFGGLVMYDGKICIRVGDAKNCTRSLYNDERLHDVHFRLHFRSQMLTLSINGSEVVRALPTAMGIIQDVDLGNQLLLGDSVSKCSNLSALPRSNPVQVPGFTGCLGLVRVNNLCFSKEVEFSCTSQRASSHVAANEHNLQKGILNGCRHDFCTGNISCQNGGKCRAKLTDSVCQCNGTGYYGAVCEKETLGLTFRTGEPLRLRLTSTPGKPFAIQFRYENLLKSKKTNILAVYDQSGRAVMFVEAYIFGLTIVVRSSGDQQWATHGIHVNMYFYERKGFVSLRVTETQLILSLSSWRSKINLKSPLMASSIAFGAYEPDREAIAKFPLSVDADAFVGYLGEIYVNGQYVLEGYPLANNFDFSKRGALLGRHQTDITPFYTQYTPTTLSAMSKNGEVSVFFGFRTTKWSDITLMIVRNGLRNILSLELLRSGVIVATKPNGRRVTTRFGSLNFHDGKWHYIMAFMNARFFQLLVDGIQLSPATWTTQFTSGQSLNISIGGDDYVGCLSGIVVNLNDRSPVLRTGQGFYQNGNCPDCVREGVCSSRGYCHYMPESSRYGCLCEIPGFQGDECHMTAAPTASTKEVTIPTKEVSTPAHSISEVSSQPASSRKTGDSTVATAEWRAGSNRKENILLSPTSWYHPWLYIGLGALVVLLGLALLVTFCIAKYKNRFNGRYYPVISSRDIISSTSGVAL